MNDVGLINAKAQQHSGFVEKLYDEVGKLVVGRRGLLEKMMITILCRGHVLLEGVHGLAKTLAVTSLARAHLTSFC